MDPPGPSRDVGGGLLRSLETDQVSRLETKDQGALPLPAPWDRSLGKSWVSAAGKVPAGDLHGKGRCGGEGAASLFTSSFMGTQVRFLGREDPLEKEMETHSSILAWKISWTEEPDGLHSPWGRKRVRHD